MQQPSGETILNASAACGIIAGNRIHYPLIVNYPQVNDLDCPTPETARSSAFRGPERSRYSCDRSGCARVLPCRRDRTSPLAMSRNSASTDRIRSRRPQRVCGGYSRVTRFRTFSLYCTGMTEKQTLISGKFGMMSIAVGIWRSTGIDGGAVV